MTAFISFRDIHVRLIIISCFLVNTAFSQPADKRTSNETKKLHINLNRLLGKGVMFGHQDALAYGVGWKYIKGKSDVKDVTGAYPAVFGWDIAGIENDASVNIDSVPFKDMKEYIRQVYDMGGVNTISWHLDNPLNGKTAWDTTHASVASVLPGGSKHELYKTWLDRAAAFFNDLKGSDGRPVPVLFRPYHELTGNWFWWCKNTCSPAEYKKLWQYTFNYLTDKKKVHNLIYVYNTASFNTKEEFLERYPGDQYVDVVSFDSYHYGDPSTSDRFIEDTGQKLTILGEIAKEHRKLPAFAETGYETIPKPDWWTNVLLKALDNHEISYVLLWRNAGYMPSEKKDHYYVPYNGHQSEKDFIEFKKSDRTIFGDRLQQFNIYK